MAETYSRIYWRIRDEYPDVYLDDAVFGAWVKLLMIAEGAHPSAADLPQTVRRSSLTKLVDAGLVILYPGNRYRIKGLEAERGRRAEGGRKGASARWSQSDRNANALPTHSERNATAMPDETRRDEHRQDETRREARASGPEKIGAILPDMVGNDPISLEVRQLQKLAEELTQQPYALANVHGGLGLKAVTEQLPHGFPRVEVAWRKITAQVMAAGTSRPTLRQLVFGADDLLNPIPQADSKAQKTEEANADFDRRVERTRRYIATLKGEPA